MLTPANILKRWAGLEERARALGLGIYHPAKGPDELRQQVGPDKFQTLVTGDLDAIEAAIAQREAEQRGTV